ncbi:MAG: hypothetical protein KGK11_06300 [Sphingomonadales bacterium]|nr:hypothetical protein [Sphingomonadales bacterium]
MTAGLALASALLLRCGAVEAPGIALRGADGAWQGAAVALCRAEAGARGIGFAFHPYRTTDDLRAARGDDLAVLSLAEAAAAGLHGWTRSHEPLARRMVALYASARAGGVGDLSGRRVCFLIADPADGALDRWAHRKRLRVIRVGFEEAAELRDALDSRFCAAIAADAAAIPGGAPGTRRLATLSRVAVYAFCRAADR